MRGKNLRTGVCGQILCAALLLALLIGMLALEAARAASGFFVERAARVTVTLTTEGVGYLFREETALLSSNNGPVDYLAADGAAVAAGQVLARVYSDDTGTDKRARAASLYRELVRLEAALEGDGTAWQRDYGGAYAGLMAALETGDLRGAGRAADALSPVLDRRAAEADAGACRARADELRAQIAALLRYVDEPQEVAAGAPGCFFRQADGREALCSPAAAAGLSPEGLERLLASPEPVEGAVGKCVSDGPWALTVPLSAADAGAFERGRVYSAAFPDCGASASLTLEEINPSADGTRALLVFRGASGAALDGARRQRVRIARERVTGLSVPACAVCEREGARGVYVLEAGVARWRRLESALDAPCGFLAAERDEAGYLAEGEPILVGVRRLYEGKRMRWQGTNMTTSAGT